MARSRSGRQRAARRLPVRCTRLVPSHVLHKMLRSIASVKLAAMFCACRIWACSWAHAGFLSDWPQFMMRTRGGEPVFAFELWHERLLPAAALAARRTGG